MGFMVGGWGCGSVVRGWWGGEVLCSWLTRLDSPLPWARSTTWVVDISALKSVPSTRLWCMVRMRCGVDGFVIRRVVLYSVWTVRRRLRIQDEVCLPRTIMLRVMLWVCRKVRTCRVRWMTGRLVLLLTCSSRTGLLFETFTGYSLVRAFSLAWCPGAVVTCRLG